MMKTNIIGVILLLVCCEQALAQTDKTTIEADLFWERMNSNTSLPMLPFVPKDTLVNGVIVLTETEKKLTARVAKYVDAVAELYSRYYREMGEIFWHTYPQDKRRYEWFRNTIIYRPVYFADIDAILNLETTDKGIIINIDTISRKKWRISYDTYRRQYLNSLVVAEDDKKKFLFEELRVYNQATWRTSASEKFDFEDWIDRAVVFINTYNLSNNDSQNREMRSILQQLQSFFIHFKEYGFDEKDLDKITEKLEGAGIAAFHRLIESRRSTMKLREIPLEIKQKSYDGQSFDLKNYRGKLVLVDFWGLSCSYCIKKMPEIKRIYDQYKDQGFEVVSACFIIGKNSAGEEVYKNEKAQIVDVYQRVGGKWPMIYLERAPGKKKHIIWEKYGFQSLPQLMLLDKDGTLLHHNGDMLNEGGLEKLVKYYLSK